MYTGSIKNLTSYYHYSTVPTEIMNSNKLSASAKGVLGFLLTLPKNHNIKKADLPKFFKEGYFALNNAFEELVDKRLIHKIELRDKKGHFQGFDYIVHEFPKKRSSDVKNVITHVKNRKSVKQQNPDLINQIFNEDCLITMKRMSDGYVDMVLTSPCYDGIRNYQGNSKFEFEKIAVELTRVLKIGGIIAWIVADETVRGSETGSSFKQALYFKEKCGLRLHDTMIFEKNTSTFPAKPDGLRYTSCFDYIFLFSKGKPKTVNLIADRKNKYFGIPNWGEKTYRNKYDNLVPLVPKIKVASKNEYSPRTNIWKYVISGGEKIAHQHPAIMPDALAGDLIASFTTENDLVYDCFAGSGSTLKMAKLNGRRFIGSEIVKDYCDIILERLKD
jgi:site-specific DNA-methyltransferase (adenine-specific)